jgi:hypothetical protein
VPAIAGTQFEIKIKPPRHGEMDLLFSLGIDPQDTLFCWCNKKTHINCGSSALLEDIMGVKEDQIRRKADGTTQRLRAYLTSLPREMM